MGTPEDSEAKDNRAKNTEPEDRGLTGCAAIRFDLVRARFIARPNRFLLRCALDRAPDFPVVEAHLADSGRLGELLVPGRLIWLRPEEGATRKTQWTAVFCERPDQKGIVSVNSTLPNRLVGQALSMRALAELAEWSLVRPEYTLGNSRWDFLLEQGGRKLLLEVKGVTLVRDGVAYFPDAITARGAKHLKELARLAREGEWETAVLFLLQRDDAELIRAAREIDPDFSDALAAAQRAGVRILGRRCHITPDQMRMGEPVAVST